MTVASARRGIALLYGPAGGAVSICAVLAIWQFSTAGPAGGGFFPSPRDVVAAFADVVRNGYIGASLGGSIAISMKRLLAGWLLCLALGAAGGFAMHFSRTTRDVLMPWLAFYRPLPPLAYLSLLVLWLGVGEVSKVVLLVMAGLPPVVIGTMTVLGAVKEERIQGARSAGLGPWQLVTLVYAPSVAPAFMVSARIAFGACFAALIGAEMIASSSGIAWMIIAATNRGAIDVALVGVITMATLALALDLLLRRIQTALVPWAVHEQ